MHKTLKSLALFGAFSAIAAVQTVQAKATLDSVKKKDYVACGVSTGLPGFSNPDDKGQWSGLDVDVCRAVAAATLGDAQKVKFVPLTAKERFTALQSGEIDMLSRNTTWTLTRDASLGLNFTGVSYYDGQGFMVKKSLGVKSAGELDGAAICIQSGTTSELNLADYFRANKMSYQAIVFDTSDGTAKGFESGRCDVLTSDQSQLYALRLRLSKPESAVVLPEVISKEPLGPVVRQGDDKWFNVVKWVLAAMINGEELGLSSENVKKLQASTDPAVRRLLGVDGPKGKGLDLDDEWSLRVLEQVGNYGEVFSRNVGNESPLKIQRGLNALWSDGGILYAPPFR